MASGANATPLAIKCWKCNGPHYAQDCKNKNNEVLHNLQEEPIIEDIAGTPRIYVALDGRQADHQATILIDLGACRSYVDLRLLIYASLAKKIMLNLGWYS